MTLAFEPGTRVVVRGHGLVEVMSTDEHGLRARTAEGDEITVRRDGIAARVRPPLGSGDAAAAFSAFVGADGPADDRPWFTVETELQELLVRGTPRDQLVALRKLYAEREPTPPQRRLIHLYEDVLIPELAYALDRSPKELKRLLRRDQPAIGYVAPEREDGPIEKPDNIPEGWTLLESFRVFSGRMLVGEGADLAVPCQSGDWFALLPVDGEDRHQVIGARTALAAWSFHLKHAAEIGTVEVEGGTVIFLDAEVCEDEEFQRALEVGETRARGYIAGVGGDGTTPIFASAPARGEPFALFALTEW